MREGAWLVEDCEVEGGRSLTRTIEHCSEGPLEDTTLVEVFLRALEQVQRRTAANVGTTRGCQ